MASRSSFVSAPTLRLFVVEVSLIALLCRDVTGVSAAVHKRPAQPNILLIISEDNGPELAWHVPQKLFDLHPLAEIVSPPIRADDLDDIP